MRSFYFLSGARVLSQAVSRRFFEMRDYAIADNKITSEIRKNLNMPLGFLTKYDLNSGEKVLIENI